MREIVLDTETTGLSLTEGHKIIEIGCVELHDGKPTERFFHQYINPQREVSAGAFNVHGIKQDFLSTFPSFSEIFQDFLLFIEDSPLVIHNAKFDLGFINAELALVSREPLRNQIIDTLYLAKKKFPGSPASLDALCQRFRIDLKGRSKHGALLDAQLLSKVYLELSKQALLNFSDNNQKKAIQKRAFLAPRFFPLQKEEEDSYNDLLLRLIALSKQ